MHLPVDSHRARLLLFVAMIAPSVVCRTPPVEAQRRTAYEELQAFSAVLQHIRLQYVDQVAYGNLVRAAIDGVLRSLDPHSYFVSAEDAERQQRIDDGTLGHVGLMLEQVGDMITVLTVLPGSPADRKGLQAGDRIREFNDTSVSGADVHAAQMRLAGERGSRVRLTIERGSRLEPERFRVTLKRESFDVPSVRIVRMLDDSTGYVWLAAFTPETGEELERAIRRRLRRASRLVLDLRGNPGGVVSAAVDVASFFLERNTLVFRTEGRQGDDGALHATTREGRFVDLSLVVLIDERSASAAEALAASLQDHDRALIVGHRSFGKALVQQAYPIPGGGVVWLTTGRVVTPSGRSIQRAYRGLDREQYLSFAGRTGAEADTVTAYRTDNGRLVRGGGGVTPDVVLPDVPSLPAWFTVAADAGLADEIADSVAFTLAEHDDSAAVWGADPVRWRRDVLRPFLERIRADFDVTARPDEPVAERIASLLAFRVIEVRWGKEAAEGFLLAQDAAVRVAQERFARLALLLAAPSN